MKQKGAMRETFPEFFGRSDEELKHFVTDATIVLDTNVLLGLYRLAPDARAETMGALEAPSVAARLWIPYQVGTEFLRNRRSVAGELKSAYGRAMEVVDKIPMTVIDNFGTGKRYEATREAVRNAIGPAVEQLRTELSRIHSEDSGLVDPDSDPIFERIQDLISGRFGQAPGSQVIRQRIETFLNYRIPNLIPPGYKDSKKDGADRAGDYLLWCEILDYAAQSDRPLLFVTEDGKDDWFEGPRGKKTGPRRELVSEFAEHSSHGYHQVGLDRFLSLARTHLSLEVDDETIDEVIEDANERSRAEAADQAAQRIATAARTLDLSMWRAALGRTSESQAALSGLSEFQAALGRISEYQAALGRTGEYQAALRGLSEFQAALGRTSEFQALSGLGEFQAVLSALDQRSSARGRAIANEPDHGDQSHSSPSDSTDQAEDDRQGEV